MVAYFSNGESLDHKGGVNGAPHLHEVSLLISFSAGNRLDRGSPRTR